jgi:tRNA modification GTPase
MRNTFSDTIVAPATNIAKQAICIIRISGEHAFKIVNQSLAKKIEAQPQTVLRNFFDGDVLLDQVLLLTFVAPNSFTGEDVIEINCHGGVLVAKKIMETIIRNGARIAERGEFSKRAFLNQKISLIQAQGINDLIEAKNDLALRISAKNMAGKTNAIVNILKNNVMDIISQVQTAIDYPEYEETENITPIEIGQQIKELNVKLLKALEISKRASVANNGLKTVIFGKPNVGKSSLLNALLNEDKAIVSDEMGTTRDIVEGEITLENFTLHLLDTAGIRKTENKLEQAGIDRSLSHSQSADLILYIIDHDEKYEDLIDVDKDKTIFIFNKLDLLSPDEVKQLQKTFQALRPIFISTVNNEIEDLVKAIETKFNMNEISQSDDLILTNVNEISKLEMAATKIAIAHENITAGFTIDLINVDLREAMDIFNDLLGLADINEEIIDNIFKKYCLGK